MAAFTWFRSQRLGSKNLSLTQQPRANARMKLLDLEWLEDRTVPAIFLVSNTLDDDSNGSLRWAMNQANSTPGADVIQFNIGTGVQTIAPTSALPTITEAVTIDGTSQPGFSGTPVIELRGNSAGANVNGLRITGSGSLIKGLVINQFSGSGIVVTGTSATGNTVQGCYLGTSVSGTTSLGNALQGISLDNGASGNTVGGALTGQGNVLSGNTVHGLAIYYSNNNIVQGNVIGTDLYGTIAIPNRGYAGVSIIDSNGTIFGGQVPAARNIVACNSAVGIDVGNDSQNNFIHGNVISSNTTAGILFDSNTGRPAPSYNSVQGNLIGTNTSGTQAWANGGGGIILRAGAHNNLIGGTSQELKNVISGNTQSGIVIHQAGTMANTIQGNYIGTDITGTVSLANTVNGIHIFDGASSNIIGGTATSASNIISGNQDLGLRIELSNNNIFQGNKIGTAIDGTTLIPNRGFTGFFINNSQGNVVGGTASGAGNLIAGNIGTGITLYSAGSQNNSVIGNVISANGQTGLPIGNGASNNIVQGNFIGTTPDGLQAWPNAHNGISIFASNDNLIGGTGAGQGNVISANGAAGIVMSDGSLGNIVQGNLIGTNRTGTAALGNGEDGVHVYVGAHNNVIGGTAAGAGNILSGNIRNGVLIHQTGSNGNIVQGNKIGTNVDGTVAIANRNRGVSIGDNAIGTIVGGTTPGAGNLISGNRFDGITIGSGATNTVIQGNLIGTNASGTAAIGNRAAGIYILNGANGTLVGGATASARNIISGNGSTGWEGVAIQGVGTINNTIQGNYIGTDITGSIAIGNGYSGVSVYNSAGSITIADNVIAATLSTYLAYLGGGNGIILWSTSTGSTITGNLIGTNAAGTSALSNASDGILIVDSPNNIIGRTSSSTRNIISGNSGNGIYISGDRSTGNFIQGNYIGTDLTGLNTIANSLNGVLAKDGTFGGIPPTASPHDNIVGGSAQGAGNLIRGNSGTGIVVDGSATQRMAIRQNQIYGNGGTPQGIALLNGGNANQLTPVLTMAVSTPFNTRVIGTYSGAASTSYSLEFFSGAAAGQAQTFLGSAMVTTNGSGIANLDVVLAVATTPGNYVVATATDSLGNTSAFSSATVISGLSAHAGGPYVISEGSSLTLNGNVNPNGYPVSYSWDVNGDGIYGEATGSNPTLTWTQLQGLGIADGTSNYNVRLRVDDGQGRVVDSLPVNLTLNNSVPTASITGPSIGIRGQTRTFTFAALDAATADQSAGFTYTIQWGDNTTQTVSASAGNGSGINVDHIYVSAGNYSVTVTARDKDGGVSATTTYSVDIRVSWLDSATNTLYVGGKNGTGGATGNDIFLFKKQLASSSTLIEVFLDNVSQGSASNVVVFGQNGSDDYGVECGGWIGTVNIIDQGTSGIDQLNVVGTDADDIFVKKTSIITWNNPVSETVIYSGLENVKISGGKGKDTITDPSEENTFIDGGEGDDTIIIAGVMGGSMVVDGGEGSDNVVILIGNIISPVSVMDSGTSGTDTITVVGTTGSDTFIQSGNQVTLNQATIALGSGVDILTVNGGGGDEDQIAVVGSPSITPVLQNFSAVSFTGTAGDDHFIISPGNAPGSIAVRLNGSSLGTFSPTSRFLVYGLEGDDNIQVAGSITLSAWLFGGAGNDRLKGGAGHDVLIGGDGDDLIAGGSGRDLIIGGAGRDRLVGDAEDDILIAGSTAFDNDDIALGKILAEWTSVRDYSTRIANLLGTGSGTSFESRLNENVYLKTTGSDATVFDDGVEDVLTGSAGQDWFIFNATGQQGADRVTDLHVGEFFSETDLLFVNGF